MSRQANTANIPACGKTALAHTSVPTRLGQTVIRCTERCVQPLECLTWQIWSLDDRAYVDTLFGHQADVLAIDARRAERVLTVGADHTCRVWKVPEESQLIYRHGSGSHLVRLRLETGSHNAVPRQSAGPE